MQEKINQDIKAAMLGKDVLRTSVLRSIKSAFTYAKTAPGADPSAELSDEQIITIIAKEAKKRQESADGFMQGGRTESAETELAEKAILEEYLPTKLGEDEIKALVEAAVSALPEITPQAMGQVIGQVKAKAGPSADGGQIAALVKERLSR